MNPIQTISEVARHLKISKSKLVYLVSQVLEKPVLFFFRFICKRGDGDFCLVQFWLVKLFHGPILWADYSS